MMPGLVSVITPCYDAAPFVGETIAAVRGQTYAPVEHVVIDDGSSDGSWAVIEAAQAESVRAGRGDRMRTVRLAQNGGASHARNVGAALARGEYLMFLDADDLLAPDTLAALVAAVRDRPGNIGVCRWRYLRRSRTGTWAPEPRDVLLPVGADHIREHLIGMCWVPPCAILWRRDVYATTGGWDETLSSGDDTDLLLSAHLDGANLALATGGEAYYRRFDGMDRLSLSAYVFSASRFRSRIRTLDKLAARLDARGRLAEYAVPLGTVYQEQARIAYQQGFVELGRECQARGEQLAGGPLPVSRSRVGRVLSRLLGMERKERVMQALASRGIGTRQRRGAVRARVKHGRCLGDAGPNG
ncbi:MAG TPA: glycosyltransferase [Gemmatimonadales bacterium]|nr:glycosyltransferase [Gemmatimonadales bacterium]